MYHDDCLLLVDTVDTLESGVPNTVHVFEELQRKGHQPVGIRLDSGDLAHLAVRATRLLNDAGFADTSVVLSGDLNELVICQIITQIAAEAPHYGVKADHLIWRFAFGVSARLITSWGRPGLGCAYRLVAVKEGDRQDSAIEISDSPAKTANPGIKRIWRLYDNRGKATADLLCLADEDPRRMGRIMLRHPMDHTKHRMGSRSELSDMEQLLMEIVHEGKRVYEFPGPVEIRSQRQADVDRLDRAFAP